MRAETDIEQILKKEKKNALSTSHTSQHSRYTHTDSQEEHATEQKMSKMKLKQEGCGAAHEVRGRFCEDYHFLTPQHLAL